MLISKEEDRLGAECAPNQEDISLIDQAAKERNASRHSSWVNRILKVEWLGQMVASLCWIASVFAAGINSVGDWLQLVAATFWMLANISSVMTSKAD